jgi:methylmalonyl-CoA/ethylmalonyl-CoA epimerase
MGGTSAGHGPAAIGQISLGVHDLDRAVAFYRDVVGLRFLFRFPGMAFFDCGGVRLYLSAVQAGAPLSTSILYYRVEDIHGAAAAMAGRGARQLRPPEVAHRDERHELWLAFFEDSEGNTLALMSEAPSSGDGAVGGPGEAR